MQKIWLLGESELLSTLEREMAQVPETLCERIDCEQAFSLRAFEMPSGGLLPSLLILDSDLAWKSSGQILKFLMQSDVWQPIPRVVVTQGASDPCLCTGSYMYGAAGYAVFPADPEPCLESIKIFVQYWLVATLLPHLYAPLN